MRWLISVVTFVFLSNSIYAQNISGKWVGKAFQDTSELCTVCNFELDLVQKKNIWGDSYTYQKDTTDIRIGVFGYVDGDTIRLEEDRTRILSNYTLPKWHACIKKIMVKYHSIGNIEYLIGRGTGESIEDGTACIPAKFVFARNVEALNQYVAMYGDSLSPIHAPEPPLAELTSEFNGTKINKAFEVEVNHRSLQIRLSDYLQVDNDTVSVYLNRNILARNVWISKRVVRIDFNLDSRTDLNELLLYAENLGKIPPNTSLLEIIDGNKTHRIRIESDKQKTAAIYLRYKKNPE